MAAKKSNKEREDEFARQVAGKLVKMIEEGTGPWQPGADPISMPMPFNGHTGRSYSGNNVISLWLEAMDKDYADPRWYTFNQLKKEGGHVRKGEKSTKIIFWKERTIVEKLDKDGNVIDKNDTETRVARVHEKRVPVARVHNVFNAAQAEGLEPFKGGKNIDFDRELEWSLSKRVENLVEKTGAVVEHKPSNTPKYIPALDKIVMPERAQFHSQDRYYESLLHELAHWTGHEERLGRPIKNQFGTADYAREELRAELAMVMMTGQLGVGYAPKNAAAYSESWIKALKDNPREIMGAAKDAQKIYDFVMQHDPGYVAPSYESDDKEISKDKDSHEVSKTDEMHPLDRFRVNQIAKKEEEIKQYRERQQALDKDKLPEWRYESEYRDFQRKIDLTQKELDEVKERLETSSLSGSGLARAAIAVAAVKAATVAPTSTPAAPVLPESGLDVGLGD